MKRVITVVPLADHRLLGYFDTEEVRLYRFAELVEELPGLAGLENTALFDRIELEANGREMVWPGRCRISAEKLAEMGELLPINREDFICFCQYSLLSTAEAAQVLRCTRQNIDNLVRRERLRPVKCCAKTKLFMRSDVLRRLWELD